MTTNKPEVKRYFVDCNLLHFGDFARDECDTQVVRLSDYEALQAECEKLRKDAARYQWLKHLAIKGSYDRDWEFPLVDAWEYRPGSEANVEHETLDAAITAATQEDNPC